MQRAYEIDSANAMVLNHMSDQYFKKWYPVSSAPTGTLGGGTALHVRAQSKSIVLETK